MKIHHLNCGSFCPLSYPLLNRAFPELDHFNLVCHCLLIESEAGLILVDTGLGLEDVRRNNGGRGKLIFEQLAKPKLDLNETAFIQLTKMGFRPTDVKHIIVTHFDADHIGGLADFPAAKVHVLKDEWEMAQNPQSTKEKIRYKKIKWQQNRHVHTYEIEGDPWQGFMRVQNLKELDPSIYLVSLPGHTKGHGGVYIEGSQALFHVGDAFMLKAQLESEKDYLPLALYNQIAHENPREAKQTLRDLQEFKKNNPDCDLFCSHDRSLFLQHKQKS
jgi:glyoxylase-like metal-dependent hydrolase (beta-lactamase superfamily II)